MQTILTNCTVIDCTGQAPQANMTVVIEDKKIAQLKTGTHQSTTSEGGSRVIDLNGAYVLPGLWGVHAHLGLIIPDPKDYMEKESLPDYTIRAGRNCMDALRVGITGIRSVGDRDFVDVAWKRAFNSGMMVGPRLFVSGHYIIATGGHGHELPGALEVDGPYQMRKVVRDQLKHGVDHIKIMVTGGVMTAGESMHESQLLVDEIEAATDVAHQKGKRVCVHAGGAAGVKAAIRGGVDCVEHGSYLDDEAIGMMAEKGTFFVPTLWVTQVSAYKNTAGRTESQLEKSRAATKSHKEGFQKVLKAGVKIAPGSDGSPIGQNTLSEIEQLVVAGMTEMQALMAATATSAELCGVSGQLGTVQVGKLADLIAVTENPLENITNLKKLKLVLKEGNIVDIQPQEGLADFWKLCQGN